MKTKLAVFLDAASGKIGSVVASTGNGGSYLRSKVIPYNPQSVDQVAARAKLTTFSQAWSALTQNQRTAWNAAVANWKSTGIFGQMVSPSGFNLYCALNINLGIISVAPIDTPPQKSAVPVLTALTVAQVHAGATTITFAASPLTAGAKYVVMATAPVSAGVSFVKSEYRIITVLAAGVTTPQVLTTAYNAKFGAPGSSGQKVFVKVYAIDSTTGQKGAELDAYCIVS